VRNTIHRCAVAGLWVAGLAIAGCSSPNVNPPAPRAHTGYVDFYTDSSLGLSWEVKRFEPGGKLKPVFTKFAPVQGTILRLAAPPGRQRFQVWFINITTEGPQAVEVEVKEGQVTPVHVALTAAGTTSVERKNYSYRGSAKGYARGTKITSDQSGVFRIEAAAEAPQPYRPQEQTPYWSAPEK
jgi:hypothetical protein